MDKIAELLGQLAELPDAQLSELESSIISEFEQLEGQDLTAESVQTMQQLADAVDAVRTELGARQQKAQELQNTAAEAAARIKRSDNTDPTSLPAPQEDAEPGNNEPNTGPVAQQDPTTSPATAPSVDSPNGAPDDGKQPISPEEAARKRNKLQEVPGQKPAGRPPASSGKVPVPAVPAASDASPDEGEFSVGQGDGGNSTSTPGGGGAGAGGAGAGGTGGATATGTTGTPGGSIGGADGPTQPQPQPVNEDGTPVSMAEVSAEVTEEATEARKSGQPLSQQKSSGPAAGGEQGSTEQQSAEGSENASNTTTTAQNSEAAVTAAANGPSDLVIEPPADRRPVPKATAQVAITAGADIPGVSAGARFRGMNDVADAFVKRLHGLRRVNGGDGEQHIVASLNMEYPEDRVLSGEPEDNYNKIQKVVGKEALAASGGWCAPLETNFDLPQTLGTAGRPVKDSLPVFNADRGGIRFMTPPLLGGYEAGISLWTAQNDINPTTPAVKPCVTVECGTEATALVDAITLCLQFGNLMTRAYPELVARHNDQALIAHSRFAEISLMEQMELGSTKITAGRRLSALRDFLIQLDRAQAAYRNRHRLDTTTVLRLIAPIWLKDLLRADLAMQMPGDGLDNTIGVADAQIETWMRARNVVPTWHFDGPGWGEQGPGELADFPEQVEWFLFAEGTWLFLDGGTLDLGIIRDSGLVGTNDYKMFVETFEGLAKVGIESFHVTSDLTACGAAAALVDVCAEVNAGGGATGGGA